MKFYTVFFVGSKKQGLELLDEYDRLKFPDEHRSQKFHGGQRKAEVPIEVARLLSDHFKDSDTIYVHVDSTDTTAEDWEDHGSFGMVLKEIIISLNVTKMLTVDAPLIEHKDKFNDYTHYNDSCDDIPSRYLSDEKSQSAKKRSNIALNKRKKSGYVRAADTPGLSLRHVKKENLGRIMLTEHSVKIGIDN